MHNAINADPERPSLPATTGPVFAVPVDSLLPADSPRRSGEDPAHVKALVEAEAELPPILVHRRTMQVIDGMHRVRAAVAQGRKTIRARFFDGEDPDVFVAAVRANTAHGLPLSLDDRKRAAARILHSHPHWSDRAIAEVTGLAHKTVGVIRRRSAGESPQLNTRVGRDGKTRVVDLTDRRRTARDLISARPDASVREIAKSAGVSVGTAHDIRKRMDDPEPPDESAATRAKPPAANNARNDPPPALLALARDPALRFSESGRALLRWLAVRGVEVSDWEDFVDTVPSHCAHIIAELAKTYANTWREFAEELERRTTEAC